MAGFAFFGTPAGLVGLAWEDSLAIAGGQLPEASDELTRNRLQQRYPRWAESNDPPEAIVEVLRRLAAALGGAPDTLTLTTLCFDAGSGRFVPDTHGRYRRGARGWAAVEA